jgi:transcriptional regulator with XRE-family HTH domain
LSNTFAQAMKALRESAGLSLSELSRRIPWSKAAIGHAETGARRPSPQMAEALDKVLGAGGLLITLAAAQHRNVAPVEIPAVLFERLQEPSGRIDGSDVQRLSDRTGLLRRIDSLLGAAENVLYAREIEHTADTLRRTVHSDETRRALHALLAEQAQFAAWAAFDSSRPAQAAAFCAMSRAAAREAEDDALYAYGIQMEAYQRAFNGRADVELARAGCDAVTPLVPARAQAFISFRAAFCFASGGLAAKAESALDTAAKALTAAEGEPSLRWVPRLGTLELTLMTGACWAILHRPLRAIGLLERELPNIPDEWASDKSIDLIYLGEAYAVGGEPELAAQAFARSSELAKGLASKRPTERLRFTLSHLAMLSSDTGEVP